jgi:hypothetical protein
MKQSESIASLAPALVKALGEMRGVAKDSKNPHFKNDYASLEAVIDVARPVLGVHGLAFMQGLGEYAAGAMTVSTRILHESGEWIESDFQMPVSKADPQGTASASTYARRYSLMSILGLPAVDDDGEASMPRSTKPGEPKNPNVSVHSDAPDWWGAEGSGMSSAQAKKDGWGDTFDVWRTEIAALSTAQAWKEWCALYSTDIKALPRGWRVHLREEAELRGKELGAL